MPVVAYGSMNIGTTDMEILMMLIRPFHGDMIPNVAFLCKNPRNRWQEGRADSFLDADFSHSFVSYSPYIEQRISICIYIYTYVYIYIVILMTSTHMSIHSITIIR